MNRGTQVTGTPTTDASKDLHWLSRYAHHVHFRPDIRLPYATAIKSCFSAAAWRLLCRSDRSSFIPILRNQQLSFDSLIHYTQTLVDNGFQVAPSPELLDYFIQASYYFFDRMPSAPASQDEMTLLRLATYALRFLEFGCITSFACCRQAHVGVASQRQPLFFTLSVDFPEPSLRSCRTYFQIEA